MPPLPTSSPIILVLAQGHAGDRLGARLVPALRDTLPDHRLVGLGGSRLEAAGARLLARADRISVMGYSGLLPQLPSIFQAMLLTALAVRRELPACVIAVDVWQPLQVLHRWAPALRAVPHVCYLPPAPNFTGPARVHGALAKVFGSIVTPFPHQARLCEEAGARVRLAAHGGLVTAREETAPLPYPEREPILALLPGSRELEIRTGLEVQLRAALRIREHYPELTPVVGCASEAVERRVARHFPGLATDRNARALLARAAFGIVCSGTAVLEAAVLGCPGVVTYNGTPLQRLEWERVHVPRLARLRAAGIASPFISLPNIIAGEELYPERIDESAEAVTEAALRELDGDLGGKVAALRRVTESLAWEDAGEVVAEEAARLLRMHAPPTS